ncbi:MAG: beta-ketoacyl-[acyl-carrier-protein] synthase family protein, partial [Thermoguttaceae bacterium]
PHQAAGDGSYVARVEVVITGIGTLCPLGIGRQAVEQSIRAGRSGIGPITTFDATGLPVRIAGQIKDFDAKQYVQPRKSLKVMARDSQLGVAASFLACEDGGIVPGTVAPERFGIVLGADTIGSTLDTSEPSYRQCMVDGQFHFERWAREGAAASFPLNFLKVLPNMIASHISIAHDARGPNNTIHHGELSSLQAVCEAVSVIQRGVADVMLAGGASSQMNPFDWVRECLTGRLSPSEEPAEQVLKPFDLRRSGQVHAEGATVLVLERREHAARRGATPIATIAGQAMVFNRVSAGHERDAMVRAMAGALAVAGLAAGDIGHVNAHGLSTHRDDPTEAAAIRAVFGPVPTTAPKSFFGNLRAASGTTEMIASLLAIREGRVPVTLNYRSPDPACPVNVVAAEPLEGTCRTALTLNATRAGQATAIVLTDPN